MAELERPERLHVAGEGVRSQDFGVVGGNGSNGSSHGEQG
jgi:hypothetical protein